MADTNGLTDVQWYRKCLNGALDVEYRDNHGLHGKTFRGRKGTEWENYVPMSFSRTLLDIAGGVQALLENWEEYDTR